ncbi:NAD-dependent epimerase/dehydratase family protein [Dyadobacter psychrophilus]|uniref:NAD dependent epimerase/dehydratase family protein n=1 Tax=Dyadobacter psychrophilus TaxID=651661 RepID=A0A1T5EI35_9BACT|nr:NAD-dependent epimerase/dehydratase family protein [Dyadobacter psychrophilus]SKB83712.1 NAD dependent epimerase/dehydratase family protein [Dyadobacter psychrophilus]
MTENLKSNKIKAIITGVTGMVGEGVLHECLQSDDVEAVLIINRKPSGIVHPKLKEIIHGDFLNLGPIADRLIGYNACYFCLGISSVGVKEQEYTRITYTLTLHVAETLVKHNPDMTFCYVSGASTDSTEKGSSMWARVKGKTENDLMKLPFKQVFAFRPGYMHPTPGLKNTLSFVKYLSWLYPLFKVIFPNAVSTLAQVGQAMIKVTQFGYDKNVLEVKDIKIVADR